MLANIEARRMASAMTEDLEELDYMRENGREGMGEGGSGVLCEGFCEYTHYACFF